VKLGQNPCFGEVVGSFPYIIQYNMMHNFKIIQPIGTIRTTLVEGIIPVKFDQNLVCSFRDVV